MASGFGCLVIGPAGSGKVSYKLIHKIFNLVNLMSRIIRKRRPSKKKLQSYKSRPGSRNI